MSSTPDPWMIWVAAAEFFVLAVLIIVYATVYPLNWWP